MRGTVRGVVAAVGLAAGGVSLGQPPATPPAPAADAGVAATVNGEVIRLAEVDAYLAARASFAPLTAAQKRQLRAEVVSDIIDDKLLRQFLDRHGPKVEAAELDKHAKELADQLAKQGKTPADFYRETGQSADQVRDTWKAVIGLAKYVRQTVTDDQLRAYFDANRDHFDKAEVKVNHIVVRAGVTASAADKAAARDRLTKLRAELVAGSVTFADAARKHSQCPTGPAGGDLGYLLRRGMLVDEAFAKAAFALKPNEVSGVIETDFGLHLIVVTDRKPGTPAVYQAVVEEVREAFTDDFRTELLGRLRKQAAIRVTLP